MDDRWFVRMTQPAGKIGVTKELKSQLILNNPKAIHRIYIGLIIIATFNEHFRTINSVT